MPAVKRRMSASDTLAPTVMVRKSPIRRMTGAVCAALSVCPSCAKMVTTVPSAGAVMRVKSSIALASSKLACACSICRRWRARLASACARLTTARSYSTSVVACACIRRSWRRNSPRDSAKAASCEADDASSASRLACAESTRVRAMKSSISASVIALARTNSGRGQVAGVTWEQADAMCALAAQGGRLWDLRDAALIAVMSDGLLRISEAAGVAVADVNPSQDGAGTLLVARSKTDPQAVGTVLYLRAVTLRRVLAWKEAAGIDSGPLFRRIRKGGRVEATALTAKSIRAIIQRWAKGAGVEGRVSGHSLRVGAAQSLVSAGATLPELQQAGRWLSPTVPTHYTRGQLAGQGAVARLRPDSRKA